jgi:hypothetical protein
VTGAGRVATQALTEGYGPSRNVDLVNAINLGRMIDLGERDSGAQTSIWLGLRNTPAASQDYQTVVHALSVAGLNVGKTYGNNRVIEVIGTTSAINAYFGTSIHNVGEGRFGSRYANVRSMTLPAAIAPFVNAAMANNLIMHKPLSHRMW